MSSPPENQEDSSSSTNIDYVILQNGILPKIPDFTLSIQKEKVVVNDD